MAIQYREYTDGVDIFRDGVRATFFVKDKVLTPTGFAGVENTDWVNIEVYN